MPNARYRGLAVLAASIALATGTPGTRPGTAAAAGAALTISAPTSATVGDLVRVDVATANGGIAAFELTATVDPAAARIEGATVDATAHPGMTDLSIADLTGDAVLAGYSPAGVTVARGPAMLGTFLVRLDQPGTVELRFGAGETADVRGRPFAVADPPSIRIDVARPGGAAVHRTYTAPALPWSLAADVSTPSHWTGEPIDAELDWQTSRLSRSPCSASLAAAAGGCLSVADLQFLVAHSTTTAQPTTAATVSPDAPTAAAAAAPFVVNSLADTWDANVGNGICRTSAGVCTLRAAIQEANAMAGPNAINFAIPGGGPFRIQLTQRLPAITDTSGGVTIDGYTQPGAAPNTDAVVSNAVIEIEIVGSGATGTTAFDGFVINSGGNALRGLSIYNLRRPIWIYKAGASAPSNVIRGDFVGTDPSGTFGIADLADEGMGIKIEQDSANTIIGGVDPADRNVISGNGRQGIGIWHSFSDNSVIFGNIIGLSPRGDRAVPNRKHGVDFNFGVSGSTLGGTAPGQRNVISGNGDDGVEVSHTSATTNNVITGNYIGTDLSGTRAPAYTANANTGVYLEDGVTANVVQDNVIGNNAKGGVRIVNGGTNGITTGTIVRRNRIGVSIDGTAIPNGQYGVSVDGSVSVIGPSNVIADNGGGGIISVETDALRNTFTQNSIYDNTGLAVDLAPLNSVNPNDPGDADSGPNTLLNHPVFTSATDTAITGTACAGCTVELYLTGSSGSGGAGNGPLRTFQATTTADGNGAFSFSPANLSLGSWLSATATDASGDTSEPADNVELGSTNHPPTVSAGADFTIDAGQSRTLQATASDPDGDPLTFTWDLDGNGSFETPGNPVTYTAPSGPATVTISVQVSDGRGGTAADSLEATINAVAPAPQAPIARFSFAPEIVAGDPLTLTLADAFDPDSTQALQYAFDCGSGFGAWSATITVDCTGLPAGADTVRGRVRDADGNVNEYVAQAVVHTNGLQNPSFETGTTNTAPGWTLSSNLARQSAIVRTGGFALVNTTTGSALAKQPFALGDLHMRARVAVNIPASSGTASFVERVRWYDGAGTLLTTTSAAPVTSTSEWLVVPLDLTVPNNATSAVLELAWNVTGAARIYVDDAAAVNPDQLSNDDLEVDANADGRPDVWWQLSRFTRTAVEQHLGSFAGQATSDGTAFTPGQRITKVVPGSAYLAAVWLDVPASAAASSLRVTVRWLDPSGTTITAPLLVTHSGATPGWIWMGGMVTAPAGASFAYLEMRFVDLNGTAYVDTAYFGRT